jgi:hypothetical protein
VTAYWRTWAEAAAVAAAALAAPAGLAAQNSDLPPPGFGSLKQDQVAVMITTASLAVRVLPLDEHVLRLLAPDTYSSRSSGARPRPWPRPRAPWGATAPRRSS